MPMTARQKKVALFVASAVIVISSIPTFLIIRYGYRLPVFDKIQSKPLPKPSKPDWFTVIVGVDNKIRVQPGEVLSEEVALFINQSIFSTFRTFVSGPVTQSGQVGLAHQFPHFTIAEYGDGNKQEAKVSSIIIVFSRELPIVSVKDDWKLITWTGERISFDFVRGFWAYENEENPFLYRGGGELKVDVFPSKHLKVVPLRPPQNKLEPRGERLGLNH